MISRVFIFSNLQQFHIIFSSKTVTFSPNSPLLTLPFSFLDSYACNKNRGKMKIERTEDGAKFEIWCVNIFFFFIFESVDKDKSQTVKTWVEQASNEECGELERDLEVGWEEMVWK